MADNRNRGSFIQLPQNLDNPIELRRFLDKLVLQLDIAFGNRGHTSFITDNNFLSGVTDIHSLINSIQVEAMDYSKLDGSRPYTGIIKYDEDKTFTPASNELIDVKYLEAHSEPKFEKKTAFNKDFGGTGISTSVSRSDHSHNYTNNPKQGPVDRLNQTISDPPTQAEVQAISDKLDTIINLLQNANIL